MDKEIKLRHKVMGMLKSGNTYAETASMCRISKALVKKIEKSSWDMTLIKGDKDDK